MNRKHVVTVIIIAAILAVLFYLQFRQYKEFPWAKFREVSTSLFSDPRRLARLLVATALIYLTYWLRAMRWKIFMRPMKQVSVASVLPAQFIGFTGLALLGRPGEFSRPYLIAKRHDVSFASQLAVWSVERLCDMGAFAVLFAIALFRLAPELQSMGHGQLVKLQQGSYVLIAGIGCAQWTPMNPVRKVQQEADGIVFTLGTGTLKLQVCSVLAAKDAKPEHLLGRELRLEVRGKTSAHGPDQFVPVAVLHPVVDDHNPSCTELRALHTALRDTPQDIPWTHKVRPLLAKLLRRRYHSRLMTWKPLHFFAVALAGWMNRQQQDAIEYLQVENRILREKLGQKRIREAPG